MLKHCLAVTICMFISGCATLLDPGPDKVPVSSHPEGAQVFVDGVSVGRTPTVVSLHRGGEGIIEVKQEGYQPVKVDRDKSAHPLFLLGLIPPGWSAFFDLVARNQGKYSTDPLYVELITEKRGTHIAELKASMNERAVSSKNLPADKIAPLVSQYIPRQANSKNWLLVIGIEKYDYVDSIVFAEKSATVFKRVAQKVFGIDDKNTYALIGEQATAGAIKDSTAFLLNRVKPGDTIYFYYSGHGIPDPKSGDAYILPRDKHVEFIIKDNEFRLDEIYRALVNSNASQIVAFIDSCFSGKTDNKLIVKGVAPGLLRTKDIKVGSQKMVVLTAGRNNQFSNSYDEKSYRMFTYFLIEHLLKIKQNSVSFLYNDVFSRVRVQSLEKGDIYLQEPQFYGNKDLKLFSD